MDLYVFIHDTIVPLGICVFLPIMVVRMIIRTKTHEDDMRKEIILAALEKDGNIDIEELVKKMNTPNKLLKEKLLKKLQWGLVTAFIGVGAITIAGCMGYAGGGSPKDIYLFGIPGAALLAVGIAFIISYVVGKKMLAKEMEAEEKNLRQA